MGLRFTRLGKSEVSVFGWNPSSAQLRGGVPSCFFRFVLLDPDLPRYFGIFGQRVTWPLGQGIAIDGDRLRGVADTLDGVGTDAAKVPAGAVPAASREKVAVQAIVTIDLHYAQKRVGVLMAFQNLNHVSRAEYFEVLSVTALDQRGDRERVPAEFFHPTAAELVRVALLGRHRTSSR